MSQLVVNSNQILPYSLHEFAMKTQTIWNNHTITMHCLYTKGTFLKQPINDYTSISEYRNLESRDQMG